MQEIAKQIFLLDNTGRKKKEKEYKKEIRKNFRICYNNNNKNNKGKL